MSYSQDNREASITTPLGKDVLLLKSMVGVDRIGHPFNYMVEMLRNPGMTVNISDLVGKKVTIKLKPSSNSSAKDRYFHGFVADIRHSGATGFGLDCYHALVVPWFWFLKKSAKCRIFRNKSVNNILEAIFKSVKFASDHYDLSNLPKYEELEHCVQYRESDFAFVSRLMEKFGIHYYFTHTSDKHKMVLIDSQAKRSVCPNFSTLNYTKARISTAANEIFRWERRQQVVSDVFEQRDYNFANEKKFPTISTENAKSKDAQGDFAKESFEQYVYEGVFLDDGVSDPHKEANIKKFENLAKVRLGSFQAEKDIAHAESYCRGLEAGYTFTFASHHDKAQNGKYFITSVHHNIEIGDYTAGSPRVDKKYACSITAIPDKTEYYPRRLTPKARIYGPQTAVVVGEKAKDEKEIFTDKHGRVKIMFHWDRESDREKTDEASDKKDKVKDDTKNLSCWVRVAQGWAGNKCGFFFLPRVGQEVVVEFLDGDPDRPIITGSVYNGKMLPPYKLPDHKTISTIKSNNVGKDGKKAKEASFNEIRFEDQEESEQIFIQAAKAMDVQVLGDRRETVGGNVHLTIGGGDKKKSDDEKIGNRDVIIEDGNDQLTVKKGDLIEEITDGNYHLKIGKVQNVTIGEGLNLKIVKNNLLVEVAGEIHFKSKDGGILLEGKEIGLKAGSSFVHIAAKEVGIKSGNVAIKGSTVDINGTPPLSPDKIKAPKIKDPEKAKVKETLKAKDSKEAGDAKVKPGELK